MNADGLLSLDYSYLLPDVTPKEIAARQPYVTAAHEVLQGGNGPGGEMTGWLDPAAIVEDFAELQATAARLREESEVMVVVGIGGSYLGARTVIEALQAPGEKEVWYAGQTLSAEYTAILLKKLEGRRFCINVVSKSGTTTEPAVAFRLLRAALVAQVGKEQAARLIVATTGPNPEKALYKTAKKEGYAILTLPDSVGGRYSVFSAVGLLPIAFAGVDVAKLRDGAVACEKACQNPDLHNNPAYVYAAARNLLSGKGKTIELLATFEPRLHYLAEWWKQLYGESEGKNHMGIFPASVEFTTDLHSMGQWIQDGRRDIFETFINIKEPMADVRIPSDPDNADELNYLAGKSVDEVNRIAYQGTALAHRDGGVPNMTITLPGLTPFSFGALLYFFEKACGVSGYLLGVNPFDQPGVEAYKNNMFALLDKPGYKDQHESVTKAVSERQGQQVVKF